MTEQLNHSQMRELSDSELLDAVRNGDQLCFGVLWERHRQAAEYAARSITSTFEPDDLVQETFTRIYSALANGKGPTNGFRAYMYTTLKSVSISWASKHETTVDISTQENYLFTDDDLADLTEDKRLTVRAFQGLPQDWKTVLWYTEIEGMTPAEIAPLLGIAPRAVSALAFRAREGLRENWLKAHLNHEAPSQSEECKWAEQYLAAYSRDSLSAKRTERMQEHLADCSSCSLLLLELATVGESLKGALLPLVLGLSPAAAALWGTPSVAGGAALVSGAAASGAAAYGAAASGSVASSSAGGWFTQVWDKAAANPPVAIAGGLAASLVVVAAAVAAALSLGGQDAASAVPPTAAPASSSSTQESPSDDTNSPLPDESPVEQTPSVERSSAPGVSGPAVSARPSGSGGGDGSGEPSGGGSSSPSGQPTSNPTSSPSGEPTGEPTVDPTGEPTVDPTGEPTVDPTGEPTVDPTGEPTVDPTGEPTVDPTGEPTVDPTGEPTVDPTGEPTVDPTDEPTDLPTPLAVTSESAPNVLVMPRFTGTGEPGSSVQVFLANSQQQAVSQVAKVRDDGTWLVDVSTDAPTNGNQRYIVKNSVAGVVASTVKIATSYKISQPTEDDFQVCRVYEPAIDSGYVRNGGTLFTDTSWDELQLHFTLVAGASGPATIQFNDAVPIPLNTNAGEVAYRTQESETNRFFAASNTIRMRHFVTDPQGNRFGPWLEVYRFSLAPSAQGINAPIPDDCN